MHLWYNKNNSLVKQKLPIERLAFCQAKPEFQFCQAHIRRFFIHSTSDCNDSTSWSRQWVYEALWFPFHCGRYDQHMSCCLGYYWWSSLKMAYIYEFQSSDDSMILQPYPMTYAQNKSGVGWVGIGTCGHIERRWWKNQSPRSPLLQTKRIS